MNEQWVREWFAARRNAGNCFDSGPEQVTLDDAVQLCRDAAIAAIAAEPELWGTLAEHDARNEHRQWVTVSAWLYPGDRICLVDSERSDEARAAIPGLELMP